MSLRHGFVRAVRTATIADEASLSGEVVCEGLTLAAIVVPAGWVAADITFVGSVDGTNFFNLHEAGSDTEVTVQAAASRYIALDPTTYAGVQRLKVRSGTSAVPVAQTGGPLALQTVLID